MWRREFGCGEEKSGWRDEKFGCGEAKLYFGATVYIPYYTRPTENPNANSMLADTSHITTTREWVGDAGVQITTARARGPEALKMVVGPLDFQADGPHWPLKIWSVITKIIND